MIRKGIHIISTFYLLLSMQLTHAQERPKIGLALSGGGAKGLAHIGVLKVIEQAGLQVDYIVGTSMGAVVGMLYAAGYSADSIEKIARWEKWDDLLSNKIDLPRIAIEEKAEFEKYIAEFPYYNKSLHIPGGVIEGQEMENELSRLATPIYHIKQFNQLPRPYKCVATSALNGKVVLLESGNIAEAVRASMSIPSLFTPVKVNDDLLVDGGLVRNFPVNYLKQMGADIFIGVNLSQNTTESQLNNIFNMLSQIMFLGDLDDTEKQKKLCDILIEPDLNGYGPSSFNSTDSLIKRGYEAALKQLDTLRALANNLNKTYGMPKTIAVQEVDSVFITKIEVIGLKKLEPSLLKGKMGLKENHWVNPNIIPERISYAFGTRYFTKISYELILDSRGTKLQLKAKENNLNYFKFAINYNSFTKASLFLNFTSRDLLFKNSRLLISTAISDFFRFKTEYFKYTGPSRNFGINIAFHYDRNDFPLYQTFIRKALYKRNYTCVDARIQRTVGLSAFIAAGVKHERSALAYDILSNEFPFDGSNVQNMAYLLWQRNSLNRNYFPSKGSRTFVEAGFVFDIYYDINRYLRDSASGNINQVAFDNGNYNRNIDKEYFLTRWYAEHYFSLTDKLTLLNHHFAGSMFNLKGKSVVNDFNTFLIGGLYNNFRLQVPFTGFMDYEVLTNNYLGTLLGFQYEIRKNIFLTAKGNILNYSGNIENYIDKKQWSDNNNYLLGYGFTAGYLSFLGPLEFTFMRDETNHTFNFYVNMGYLF
ncbi:MAG: patatin-like phospholipase family protein [Bacteroidota bacterium]|jgi:NTE family protein